MKRVKTHSLEREHILTGILKCPGCGANMYGNVNRKRHPKGGTYRDYFYYACEHPTGTTGHKCDYHKQWGQDIVNDAVAELMEKDMSTKEKILDAALTLFDREYPDEANGITHVSVIYQLL